MEKDTMSDMDISIDGLTVGGIISSNTDYSYTTTYTSPYVIDNTSSPTYTIGTGTYPTHNFTFTEPDRSVEINADGINIKDDGDLKIGDVSLKEFMKNMQDRLAILVPDPEKLEKFEALKRAYEHYKTLEKLCFNDTPEDKSV